MEKEHDVLSAGSTSRPRKTNHVATCPLVQVRQAAKLTQALFAARLGVSLSTIKSIERGSMPCSGPLAAKVEYIFGADRNSLLSGTQARAFTQHPYTNTIYKNWAKLITLDDEEADWLAEHAARTIKALIVAANRQGKLFGAVAALEEFVLDYTRGSKLIPSLKIVLGSEPYKGTVVLDNPTFTALTSILKKRLKTIRPQQPTPSKPAPAAPKKAKHKK